MVAVRVLSPAQREASERNTHARLRASAIQLAESASFEQITVDDIAERAQISRRTFFRYYASKEDVLFSDHAGYLLEIKDELSRSTGSPIEAAAASMHVVADGYLADQHMVLRRRRLLQESPLLAEREALWFHEYEKALEAHLGNEQSLAPGLNRILPAALIAALRHSLDTWAAHPRELDLASSLQELGNRITRSLETGLANDVPPTPATEIVVLRTHHSSDAIGRAIRALDKPTQ